MGDGDGSLTSHLDDATSVLLVAPPAEPPDDHACIDLLTFDAPARENVLSITLSQTPDERLAVWQREAGEPLPERAVVVDGSGAAAEGRRTATSDELPALSVDVLSDAAGPMELALTIGRYFGEWADTSERTLVCLHSLSDLLASFDRGEVVQLINAVDARLDDTDAVVHYHLDPDAHDERLLTEVRPLFDAVVEHVPGHGWTATTSADDAPTFRGESSAQRRGPTATDPLAFDRSIDAVLDALSDGRQRLVLGLLAARGDEPVSLETLADEIVEREAARAGGSAPRPREVRISLAHHHLPKLDDLGLVEYDHDAMEVRNHDVVPDLAAFVERLESA